MSAQAGPLADAEARKQVVVQETAVAELEAEREEKRLDTQIRKPADAAAYEKQVQAEAERVARISIAEAQAREVELAAAAKAKQIEQIGTSEARITSQRGIAEGEATKASGEAEGASIRAKGLAEAEAIAKRAEALEKEADAVIGQQLAEQLPEIVRAAAESFKHVDNLTILNGAQGVSEIIAQVIGQAGPALEMAQGALQARQRGDPGARRQALLAQDFGPGAARVAVAGLERDGQARVGHGVGGGQQPHGPAALLVRVERARRDAAPAVRRDEPELVEPVRARVAQALDVELDLAPDRGDLDRGGDVHRTRRSVLCSATRCTARAAREQDRGRRGGRGGGRQREPRQPRQPAAPGPRQDALLEPGRDLERRRRPLEHEVGAAQLVGVAPARRRRRRGAPRARRVSAGSSCPSAHSTRSGCSAIEAPLAQRGPHRTQRVEGAGLDRAQRHVELAGDLAQLQVLVVDQLQHLAVRR